METTRTNLPKHTGNGMFYPVTGDSWRLCGVDRTSFTQRSTLVGGLTITIGAGSRVATSKWLEAWSPWPGLRSLGPLGVDGGRLSLG